MYFKKCILLLTAAISVIALSSCGKSKETAKEVTPAPTATAAPTQEPTPTAAPTETPTATPTETAVDSSASNTLSDDLYSFQFSLNGTVYTLPCAYSELNANGWSLEGIEDQTLEPGQYTFSDTLSNGDMRVYASLVNTDADTLPMEECNVGNISIDNYQAETGAVLIFPKNITFGSTYDEVIAAYGTPTDESDLGTVKSLSYNLDTYSSVVIEINKDTNTVDSMEMENLIPTETSSSASSANSGEVPEVVKNYSSPAKVGKTWDSFDLKFADAYYHLPAPVSSFIDNGWTMVTDGNEMLAAKDSTMGVELRKDNQVMSVSVRNYADTEQPVTNCFVIRLKRSDFEAKVSIELPKGITENSKAEDIIAAYGDPTDKDSSGSSDFYEYSNKDGSISFSISKDTKAITTVEVYNDPREAY